MPKSAAVLDQARELLSKRLAEVNEERQRLERALSALGAKTTRRGPGRPRDRKGKSGSGVGAPKPGRKRRAGGRDDQVVALIEKSPGIGAADVAKRMKIQPNYLYRVLGNVEKEGRVRKDGRQYYPVS